MRWGIDKTLIVLTLPILIQFALPVVAFGDDVRRDLTELSIEELMNVEVTLAARKPRKLSQTAAAIFVITREDIRRSGATSLPEILRMTPGMNVARIDSSKWAVSTRGFNGRYADKLLVLIDGRSVYTPIFSGVFWESQDVFLEDVDRIEIIRGPGASLWGANAVNGVINIITKHTDDTRGGLAYAGIGTEDRVFGGTRYGGDLGQAGGFRVYAKYFDRDETRNWDGKEKSDNWDMFRSGFRSDTKLSGRDEVTCLGNLYYGETNNATAYLSPVFPYASIRDEASLAFGGNATGRWRHTRPDGSAIDLQLYYERRERGDAGAMLSGDIIDVDFQHRFSFGIQDFVWGLGYRYHQDEIAPGETIVFDPPEREYQLCSAFLQDDITLLKDRLRLTLGVKIEHNDFTGLEVQPNSRLLWTPSQSNVFWCAVARAVGTPSRLYSDIWFYNQVLPPGSPENPSPYPLVATISGNPNAVSEKLTAFEIGHRFRLSDQFSLDTTAFYNVYKDLLTAKPETPFMAEQSGAPYLVTPFRISNMLKGVGWGMECAANWKPLSWWRLSTAYSLLCLDLQPEEGSVRDYGELRENTYPKNQVSLRSSAELPGNLELDIVLRYVDSLHEGAVGEYTELDARVGWQPARAFEFSISGKNLLDSGHPEFIEQFVYGEPCEIERGVFGKVTWRF